MSLIFAKKRVIHEFTTIHIVGDTLLINPLTKTAYPYTQWRIKTSIISPYLAISWAGNEYYADIALKEFKVKYNDKMNREQIINFFRIKRFESHEYSESGTDFILCFWSPDYPEKNRIVEIVEIKENVIRDLESSWIGDEEAYINLDINNQNLIKAMDNLIESNRYSNVGGLTTYCVLHVSGIPSGFRFGPYFDSMNFSLNLRLGINPIPIGSASDGAWTINFNSDSNNRNAAAYYFHQGKFGLVFKEENGGVLKAENPISQCNSKEFEKLIFNRFGLNIPICYK